MDSHIQDVYTAAYARMIQYYNEQNFGKMMEEYMALYEFMVNEFTAKQQGFNKPALKEATDPASIMSYYQESIKNLYR